MGYSVKVGKGGYGLEVYDSDGKYANDFSFEMEGQTITGYDDFRTMYFNALVEQQNVPYTVEQLEDYYKNNMDFKSTIDNQLYDEYNNQLQIAVDKKNAEQIWNSPEETAKHLDELFVPSLVNTLLENNILNTYASEVAQGYKVSTLAACIQMFRYPKNRGNAISEKEFMERMDNLTQQASQGNDSGGLWGSSNSMSPVDYRNFIEQGIKDEIDIPINRGIDGFGLNQTARDTIYKSFYEENNPQLSCLAHYDRTNCSYLGSVTYFSTFNYSYNGGIVIKGLVKLNPKLRLLECPLTFGQSGETRCNTAIPEIQRFRAAIVDDPNFEQRMKDTFMNNGGISEQDASNIYTKLKNEISRDPGLCAMLMGYDAIYGISYHFDILNLGICDLLEKGE